MTQIASKSSTFLHISFALSHTLIADKCLRLDIFVTSCFRYFIYKERTRDSHLHLHLVVVRVVTTVGQGLLRPLLG